MRASKRVPGPVVVVAALSLLASGASCGADARGADTCRRVESARCERAPACIPDFPGSVDSCKRFYEVHCGSGVQPAVKDPTSLELAQCLQAIGSRCDAVVDPTKVPECSFLVAQLPVVDAGAPADAAAADVLDAD